MLLIAAYYGRAAHHWLRCTKREDDQSLTAGQITTLRLIIAKGVAAHKATTLDGWARWIVNPDAAAPSQLTFATQAVRHLLADRPQWTVADPMPPMTRRIDGRSVARTVDSDALDLGAFAA